MPHTRGRKQHGCIVWALCRLLQVVCSINRRLQQYATQQPQQQEGLQQLHRTWQFMDCYGLFLTPEGQVDRSLLPDGLHPARAGGRLLAQCVRDALQRAL
jgi:hypothetical protein